jgi:hypothetical protein
VGARHVVDRHRACLCTGVADGVRGGGEFLGRRYRSVQDAGRVSRRTRAVPWHRHGLPASGSLEEAR